MPIVRVGWPGIERVDVYEARDLVSRGGSNIAGNMR